MKQKMHILKSKKTELKILRDKSDQWNRESADLKKRLEKTEMFELQLLPSVKISPYLLAGNLPYFVHKIRVPPSINVLFLTYVM